MLSLLRRLTACFSAALVVLVSITCAGGTCLLAAASHSKTNQASAVAHGCCGAELPASNPATPAPPRGSHVPCKVFAIGFVTEHETGPAPIGSPFLAALPAVIVDRAHSPTLAVARVWAHDLSPPTDSPTLLSLACSLTT